MSTNPQTDVSNERTRPGTRWLWFHKLGSPPHAYRIAGLFRPWLLAGGLTPDNILNAIDSAIGNNFSGVDLSSGVEIAPGDKDLTKVAQLFANLSQLANH